MTKTGLIANTSECLGLPLATVQAVFDELIAQMEEALCDGDRIVLKEFISLEPHIVEERAAFNPVTREAVTAPRSARVKVRTSRILREKLTKASAKWAKKAED